MTSESQLKIVEALLFAAAEPLDEATIAAHLATGPLGEGADVPALLTELQAQYAERGVRLAETGGKWSFRTAAEYASYLKLETVRPVKISKVAAETLAVIAYHQPITRPEIEAVRGVATSKETLEKLLETGWVRMGPRRETPGQPVTWLTTPAFLDHFGLSSTKDLPGMAELKAAGLLDATAPVTYGVVKPDDVVETARADDAEEEEVAELEEEDDFEDEEETADLSAEALAEAEADEDELEEEDDEEEVAEAEELENADEEELATA